MMKPVESPTRRLLAGLAVTLAAVGVYSAYALHQMRGLEDLQTQIVDRNRKDSLQLLRIQKDLNDLAIDMRDMLYGDEPYPLAAWRRQFDGKRADLDDALRREAELAPVHRDPSRQSYLAQTLSQFWLSAGHMFDLAEQGQEREAREMIRTSLET